MGDASISKAEILAQEHKLMSLYIDNAKTYTQLSTGALALSITFLEKVIGPATPEKVSSLATALRGDWFLGAAWGCWLLAAVAGGTYQYLGVKYLENLADEWALVGKRSHRSGLPDYLTKPPWRMYTVLMGAFYLDLRASSSPPYSGCNLSY